MNKLELEHPQEQTVRAECIGVLDSSLCIEYFRKKWTVFSY